MPRDSKGKLTTVDLGDVLGAVIESIEFDFNTNEDTGGSGVWKDDGRQTPIEDNGGTPTGGQYLTLITRDGEAYRLTLERDPASDMLPERIKAVLTQDPSVRRCLWFDETHFVKGQGFQLNIVTENEAGYSPFSPDSPMGAVYVGSTYAEAAQIVAAWNAEIGISRDDAFDIVGSSMAAGR